MKEKDEGEMRMSQRVGRGAYERENWGMRFQEQSLKYLSLIKGSKKLRRRNEV